MSPSGAVSLGALLVWREFEELSVHELHAVLQLRCQVFVVEQRCAWLEVDGRDPEAVHLLALGPDDDALRGCLRCLPSGEEGSTDSVSVFSMPRASLARDVSGHRTDRLG